MTARVRDTGGGCGGRALGAASPAGRTQADTAARERGRVVLLQGLAERLREVGELLVELAEDVQIGVAAPGEQSVHALVEARAQEPLIGVKEIAARLGVSPKTVRRMRERGELPPAFDLGAVLRWRPEDVDQWLADHTEAKP